MTIPDKIEVRNGGLKLADLLYLGLPAAVVVFSLKERHTIMGLLCLGIFGSMFIYFAYQMFQRFTSKEIKIEFSDSAINLLEERERIPWTTISEVEIRRGDSQLLNILDVYLLITVETKADINVKTVDIGDYKFDKKLVPEYCRIKINQHFDTENNSYLENE